MKKLIYLLVIFLCYGLNAQNEFADVLVEANFDVNGCPQATSFGAFFGGTATGGCEDVGVIDPEVVLGDNNSYLSVPNGSSIIIQFTDNCILDIPGQNDLFIEEVGASSELGTISVSSDGINFLSLGTIDGGTTNEVDIATAGLTTPVKFVKIEGTDCNGCAEGFDVVSVYGLPGANCAAAGVTQPEITICPSASVQLNDYVAGIIQGTWSGEGVSGGVFTGTDTGDFQLYYVVEDISPSCPIDTAIFTVTVANCDCAGVINGSSTLDDCGVCDADPNNDNATCADCAGVPNGSNTTDNCGVCDDDPSNDNQSCLDCLGVINGTTLPGTACDDGDACTTGDVYGMDCNCAGTFADADSDGVCDAEDVCPDFDDTLIGSTCDDGDACTINDTYLSDCSCVGTFEDSDGDTVCDAEDVCPDFDDALIGTACDDGEACTINDVYGADCGCAGTLADADGDGVCDSDDVCPDFDDTLIGSTCDDGDACTINDTYLADCSCVGTFADSDGDTVCDAEDQCPGFDDGLLGTSCDDGDACTVNDFYGPDCECAGIFADDDGDGVCDADDICPMLDDALIGTVCDDNDVNTEDDVYTLDCICLGTPICMGQLGNLELNREGALCADNSEVPMDGTETYTWYNSADEEVALFTGSPCYSPSEIGTYYVIVYNPNYDCFQQVGPRTIDTLDGCCELEDE